MTPEDGHFWGGLLIGLVLSTLAWCEIHQDKEERMPYAPPQREILYQKHNKTNVPEITNEHRDAIQRSS